MHCALLKPDSPQIVDDLTKFDSRLLEALQSVHIKGSYIATFQIPNQLHQFENSYDRMKPQKIE